MKQRFSQIFLKDNFFIQKIVSCLNVKENDVFLEVGPGEGIITKEIIKQGAIVIVIEIDYNLVKKLREEFSLILDSRLFIINGDFLRIELNSIKFNKFRFFSNLPYHITHSALFKIVKDKEKFIDIHIMLQKEVAEKILKKRNFLHFLLNYHFEISELFTIPPYAFSPRPRVFSSFLKLIPKHSQFEKSFEDRLFKIIKIVFLNKRRKLKNVLRNVPREYEDKRAEELVFEDFVRITRNYLSKH